MFLFIDEKLDAFSKRNKFKKTVECVFKEKTRHLKTDNGCAYIPQQNGGVERD